MTITAGRSRNLEEVLREDTDVAEQEYAGAVAELVEDARAEARAAGRQLRVIHRMWQLQERAQEGRRAVRARWSAERPSDPEHCVPEPGQRTVLDVADEIGPALRLPASTAVRRVENAVLLAELLPGVLRALETGAIALRQVEVIVDLWRDLAGEAGRTPEQWTPGDAVVGVVDELLAKAPTATAAQLRALARRRRAWLRVGSAESRHRAARRGRRVWIEPEEDGMARLCALLDAATAHAVHARLASIAARVDPHVPPSDVLDSARGGQGAVESPGQDRDQDCGYGRPRTAGQLRADVLASLLLDGEPTRMPEHLRGIRGQVAVTVPVLALLEHHAQTSAGGLPGGPPTAGEMPGDSPSGGGMPGASSNSGRMPGKPPNGGLPNGERATGMPGQSPNGGGMSGKSSSGGSPDGERATGMPGCAELEGYGPIPMSVAERIAAGAGSWSRVLTHPVTGTVLDHDRTTYAVPADLKRRLRARDGTCRFPGCRRRAEQCDLDHTVAWVEGGPTAADNLAHLCRHHHVLKHRHGPLGRWQVRHRRPGTPEGVLEWISPAGRVHVTYPQQHHHPVLSPLRIADGLPVDAPPPAGPPTPDSSPPGNPWTSHGQIPCAVRPHAVRPHDDPPPF
ncbi:HNH endonuclease signature motif containing protein [Kocuria aegyptia]|uniref:HNH nuclease domain-containing protein n=1 Tax=Kocuria aegyptia TaxID=330943 RepID=A0ABN2K5V2_9MICC